MDNKTIFDDVLNKAVAHLPLNEEEIETLLSAKDSECEALYEAARTVRSEVFGSKLFGYGFVYFSTYCKNNCTFCYYRKSNTDVSRYRKSIDEILQMSIALKHSGVHLLDLTLGEDPKYVHTEDGLKELMHITEEMKKATNLPIMLSPGVLTAKSLEKFSNVDFYACYQETHNKDLFLKLRGTQSYEERLQTKIDAMKLGILPEEGVLVGVGETLQDIAHSIYTMKQMGVAQIRVMSFVPQKGAPLKNIFGENLYERELNTIAVMRLVMPNRFIPASLDVAGKAGLKERLNAGANIVTSLIVANSGFAGVSNATLDVDNGGRSIEGIQETISKCNLEMGSNADFENALQKLHEECEISANSNNWRQASGS